MMFRVNEIINHSEISISEISLVQVESYHKYKFLDKKDGWELRLLTSNDPLKKPNPKINDIIQIKFNPKYTFDTKKGVYKELWEALKNEVYP